MRPGRGLGAERTCAACGDHGEHQRNGTGRAARELTNDGDRHGLACEREGGGRRAHRGFAGSIGLGDALHIKEEEDDAGLREEDGGDATKTTTRAKSRGTPGSNPARGDASELQVDDPVDGEGDRPRAAANFELHALGHGDEVREEMRRWREELARVSEGNGERGYKGRDWRRRGLRSSTPCGVTPHA